MSFSTFSIQQNGALMRVTLNNPPVNLMSAKMTEELFQLAGHLHSTPGTQVVLLDSANPDFFVAHFDLEDIVASASDPTKGSRYPDINILQSLALSWKALPQVRIAKINGRCRGGGLEFVLGGMDMRFATPDSLLCFPEAGGGFLAAGGGTSHVALMAGPSRGLEFLLSSRDFSGTEAERYGLINRALPAAELDAYLEDLIARLLLRSPEVVAMHRATFAKVFTPMVDPLFAGLAAENDGLRAGLAGKEMVASMLAMLKNGQTRENELDLPATLARVNASLR